MLLILCALISLIVCSEEYVQQFRSWKETHQKVYSSELEENVRFQNFIKTIGEINTLNEHQKVHGTGATFGVNKFSDMTNEEFKAIYLQTEKITPTKLSRSPLLKSSKPVGAPQLSVDWRKQGFVTPVKNQRQCGSCWAFAAVEAVETAYLMSGSQIEPLSTQQLVDCVGKERGCKGEFPENGLKYARISGLVTDRAYPYVARVQNCTVPASKSYKIGSYNTYPASYGKKTEENIYQIYAAKGPVIVHNLDVAGWRSYRSGVLTSAQCKPEQAYHAPQIVGWNLVSPNNYWLLRNTWGPDWGEQGYIRMEYGNNTCGMSGVLTLQASI